jgi:hypothetical protein
MRLHSFFESVRKVAFQTVERLRISVRWRSTVFNGVEERELACISIDRSIRAEKRSEYQLEPLLERSLGRIL